MSNNDGFSKFGEPLDREHDEAVGYKNPPKDTRFKKGRSGNPRGRPKGSGTLLSDVLAELGERVDVTENGRRRKITKQRLFAKQLTTVAIKGDASFAALLLRVLATAIAEEPAKAQAPVSAEDRALLTEYLRLIGGAAYSKDKS